MVFSITALVLFWVPFLGILLALVGLVLGIITWSTAGKKRLSKGMPVAATIVSVLALLGGVTVTALVVWLADDVVACSDSSLTPDQQQRCLENRLGVNQ